MINILGIHLTLLIGPTVPIPAPPSLALAVQSVEVTHSEEGRSGFQITFQAGRSGPLDLLDYSLLTGPLLRPFNRVVLIVTFNATPHVLMDGIITNQQLNPGDRPGSSTVTVTGEDVSLMMDREEKQDEHLGQDETIIAFLIMGSYFQYLITPLIISPPSLTPPLPVMEVPVQYGTDLAYLKELAGRYGYVFYVSPGPAPLTNTGYWGPPIRADLIQPALSVNMGQQTNVNSIDFQYDSLGPTLVSGQIQDSLTNQSMPLETFASLRPPLASQPAMLVNYPNARRALPRDTAGLNYVDAYARAQGVTDTSVDNVVTASGELDALRYGDLLQPHALVGLRGAGYNYDGLYHVKSVTHRISKGEYTQRFSLRREGVGSLTPVVRT